MLKCDFGKDQITVMLSHTVTRGPPENWKDRFASVFAQTLSKTSRRDEEKIATTAWVCL